MKDEGERIRPIYTIPFVAKMFDWNRWRMERYLKRANERMGGMLLKNVGEGTSRPRWTVSISALKSLNPQWFLDPEEVQCRFAFLEEHAKETEENMESLQAQVNALKKAVEMLTDRIAGKRENTH